MDAKVTTNPNDNLGNADIAFLTASTLASAGKLDDAHSMLCPGGQLPSSPQALDLLARIALRSGDVEQARKYWQAASQASPAYEPARQALESLSSPWFFNAAAKRVAVLMLLGFMTSMAIIGLLAMFRQFPQLAQPYVAIENRPVRVLPTNVEPRKSAEPTVTPTEGNLSEALKRLAQSYEQRAGQLESQLQTLLRNQEEVLAKQAKLLQMTTALAASNTFLLAQQQTVLDLAERTELELHDLSDAYVREQHSPTSPAPQAANPPSFTLVDDNVTVTAVGSGWQVCFKSALFDRDNHLKVGAKSQIESAAKAIIRSQQKVHIQVVGYADNEPPTWPWAAPMSDAQLSQLRAERVKTILARTSLFPATALSATNGASSDLPHPGDSRRNRTVVLRISEPR